MVLRVSMAVFWMRRKASGSLSPEPGHEEALRAVHELARLELLLERLVLLPDGLELAEAGDSDIERGAELRAAQRLDEEAEHAGVDSPRRHLGIGVARQQHDRARQGRHHAARRFHAVAVGQAHRQQQHVGTMLVHEPHGVLHPAAIAHDGTSLGADGLGHGRPGRGVIIDDQNPPSLGFHASV